MGDWKLVMMRDEAPQLYNLTPDISETRDQAASQPARVKEIKAAYDVWNAQMMEPRWGGGANKKNAKKENRKKNRKNKQ
jgi:hypothetical protein